MNREELKAKAYEDYAAKSETEEYPGVMMFYVTKDDGMKNFAITTSLTKEEFYQKLTNIELREDFEGFIGEDTVSASCTYHFSRPSGLYGPAVDRVLVDYKGRMFVSNGEYSTRVNYCPFTGEKAAVTLTQSEQEIDGKIAYNYE